MNDRYHTAFTEGENALLDPHTHFSAFHVCEREFHLLQSRIQSQNAV